MRFEVYLERDVRSILREFNLYHPLSEQGQFSEKFRAVKNLLPINRKKFPLFCQLDTVAVSAITSS